MLQLADPDLEEGRSASAAMERGTATGRAGSQSSAAKAEEEKPVGPHKDTVRGDMGAGQGRDERRHEGVGGEVPEGKEQLCSGCMEA